MYKPLQIQSPQSGNPKTLRYITPPNVSLLGVCLENCPQIQSKTKEKRQICVQQ